MKTLRDFLFELRINSQSKEPLNEMPMRNNVDRAWAKKTILELWELASDEVEKVGDVGSEEVYSVSLGSTIFYYFLVKQRVPVFAATFEKRLDINGLQEDNVAKGSSVNSAEKLYKFICNHKRKHIISSASHSLGMEKVWKAFMKKYDYEVFDDASGKRVSDEGVYPSNKVVRILFK